MLLSLQEDTFAAAERRLFAHYGVVAERRRLKLADPAMTIAAHESGHGEPVVFVHGSGMSGATWAPLLAHLDDRRAITLDLPGFGASDPYSYTGRSLRQHAVAQLESALDALGLERAALVGTSLGAYWALSLALDRPERVWSVTALGVPAVAFEGLRANAFFRVLSTPGLGRLVARAPTPKTVAATRKGMAAVLGERALDRTPDEFFDVVRLGMRQPGWSVAMRTHLVLAMRAGRVRPGNVFTDDELRSIRMPVQLIWGDDDVYGGPGMGRHAADVLPDARLEVLEGGHAPFLDDPERCAQLIHRIT
jgi:pimeloyl-ACP methyl ester carboxylesterase